MILEEDILKAKIMIIDDSPMSVMWIEETLKTAGYRAVAASNDPREAVALYEEFRPDLILLDINMPYMSGFEVIEELKKVEKDIYLPIMVITAEEDDHIRLKALNAGAKDFINKPFNKIETLARIHNMLEVRLLHNQAQNQNELLEVKVRERTKEVHDTRLEIIHRLALAAEFKDDETGNHIVRMSKMCELLGRAAGMNAEEVDLLLNASPMHDIGKIGISDKVLLKPGKLDAEERKNMETHTTIGARILEGHHSKLLRLAREVALTHHEKWDGTGYPKGLKGDEILLAGRICAICDKFDALTSKRPYKKAWSIEKSVEEVTRCSGTDFDPELVDLFLANLDGVKAIKSEFSSPGASAFGK